MRELIEYSHGDIRYKAQISEYFTHAAEIESRLRHLHLAKNESFLDVGAAVGSWSIPASYLCEKVYAFEPVRPTFDELQQNLDVNGITNVVPVLALVADVTSDSRELVGVMRDYTDGDLKLYNLIAPCYSIDYFCAERGINNVGLIKIDVEGSEVLVLRGAINTIMRQKPRIMVEIHNMYGITIDAVCNLVTWMNWRYQMTIMPCGAPNLEGMASTVFGQANPTHFHAYFEVKEPLYGGFNGK